MNTGTSNPVEPSQADGGIVKQLFLGRIVDESLFPYPRIRERDREVLGAITEAVDDFLHSKAKDLKQYDRLAEQPEDFIQALREMGLFSLIIRETYGGLELSNGAYARVLAQTSSHDSQSL